MNKKAYYIINGITFYRLIAAPFLFYLMLSGNVALFKWMMAISFFTDAIDGWLARRFGVNSIFGAKLDSIADDLTVLAGIVAIIMLKPSFIQGHIVPDLRELPHQTFF
jgi:CDP-diacylglycerol--glycerol-3-phosphate 3-phosphatidyltransferase